ncbi:hypothetical protein IAT38_001756 [Cryptococcus sp. DSM 104549]
MPRVASGSLPRGVDSSRMLQTVVREETRQPEVRGKTRWEEVPPARSPDGPLFATNKPKVGKKNSPHHSRLTRGLAPITSSHSQLSTLLSDLQITTTSSSGPPTRRRASKSISSITSPQIAPPEEEDPDTKLVFSTKRIVTANHLGEEGTSELLHSATPRFPTLNTELLETHCCVCLMDLKELKELRNGRHSEDELRTIECGRCGNAKFCSSRCYSEIFNSHFFECRTFALGIPTRLTSLSKQERISISDLYDSVCEFLEGPPIVWERYHLKNKEDAMMLIRKTLSQTFTLHSPFHNVVGLGMSPSLQQIPHSCDPSALIVFPYGAAEDGGMKLVARRDLQPVGPVTISYIDQALPVDWRDGYLSLRGVKHSSACRCLVGRLDDPRLPQPHRACQTHDHFKPVVRDAKEKCIGCRTACDCLDEDAAQLQELVDMESQGVLYSTDINEEFSTLNDCLGNLSAYYSTTHHIMHVALRRRARIYLHRLPPSIKTLQQALSDLHSVADALLIVHNNLMTPQLFWTYMSTLECHLKLLSVYLETAEAEAGRGVGMSRRWWTKNGSAVKEEVEAAREMLKVCDLEVDVVGLRGGPAGEVLRADGRELQKLGSHVNVSLRASRKFD